jgi:hypothetical protein
VEEEEEEEEEEEIEGQLDRKGHIFIGNLNTRISLYMLFINLVCTHYNQMCMI